MTIGSEIAEQLLSNNQFRQAHDRNAFWQHRMSADLLGQLFPWAELNRCLSFNRITNDRFRKKRKNCASLEAIVAIG